MAKNEPNIDSRDPRVNKMLDVISNKMSSTIMSESKNNGSEDMLVEILEAIRTELSHLRRDVKYIVQEEFEKAMRNATIIQEGTGNEATVILGKYKFKGTLKPFKTN